MQKEYSLSLIALLKGIVYDHQREVWENLSEYEHDIKKYFLPLGLELYINKSEGFCFLRQIDWNEEENLLPRLAEKRPLNFLNSLLCIMLRKHLLERDAQGGSVRTTITEQEIINRIKVFLPVSSDEAKQQEKITTAINKIVEIGFLRKLNDQEYEIHRIIKGFVNADVIDEALKKMHQYAAERKTTD
ncbi:MAG: DUF4194 domain-containing protein [Cyclobacteriaceae bacterium]|jgi:hypothetical protein|nr:DUF4194 domain-containing protein [Cyclobacteriaceae bacterium]